MPVRRSTILVAAFAALLVITAGAAWAIWKNTQEAQTRAAELHGRDLVIQAALGGIRSNLYLAAIIARDSLLDPSPDLAEYSRQFSAIEVSTKDSVRTLRQQIQGRELEGVLMQLEGELGAYARSNAHLLSAVGRSNREEALKERAGMRGDILELAEQIERLSTQSSVEQRMLSAAEQEAFGVSLGWIGAVALLLGGTVGGLALARMRLLEEHSAAAETQLRSLSGQLRTTQEDERRHLSRELHDQVGQMLTGLRMELAAIGRTPAAATPEVQSALERAKRTTERTLSVVRNIAMLLRPSMLDDLGLTPALTWLAKEVERTSGIEVRREIDAAVDRLPDPHRTCLYRVVQEALTNVCRHSGARSVDLWVVVDDGQVRARITDHGAGFDASAKRNKGLGLVGMEERVRELGGSVHIVSAPGRGASIQVMLPEPEGEGKRDGYGNNQRGNNEGDDRGRSRDRADRPKAAV